MKKLIYNLIITVIVFLSIHTSSVMAQGSLEFNRIVLVDDTEQTVPVDKVWKVVGVAGQRTQQNINQNSLPSNFSPDPQQIFINQEVINVEQILAVGVGSGRSSVYSGAIASPTTFPLWFPENTTLEAGTNVSYISVIEFNVVP